MPYSEDYYPQKDGDFRSRRSKNSEGKKQHAERMGVLLERLPKKRFHCPGCKEMKSEVQLTYSVLGARCGKCNSVLTNYKEEKIKDLGAAAMAPWGIKEPTIKENKDGGETQNRKTEAASLQRA